MLMPAGLSHEDYTLKFILDSSLSEHIIKHFGDDGVTPQHVAALIDHHAGEDLFVHDGTNYTSVLRQIVSSECDADRMDYLQRDSVYCGVNYGKFDSEWLINNLVPVEQDKHIFMGVRHRAIFSFEDFLLSRYHMFASVYLHHTPVIFEKMLEKHFQELEDNFELPSDIEEYAKLDDVELWHRLRRSDNEWANRVVNRRPYYLVDESPTDNAELEKKLNKHGVRTISSRSKSVLSKYFGQGKIPMFVLTNSSQILPLEQCTPLYERYNHAAEFYRIFVNPDQRQLAGEVLRA
jgi:HD superfamily phosphohydrolase